MRDTVFITGASGFLGTKLVNNLLENTRFDILAILLDIESAEEYISRFKDEYKARITVRKVSELDMLSGRLDNVCSCVHLAFSRRTQPFSDIASSIDFSGRIFKLMADNKVPRVIYVSSQGIYGTTPEIRTEETVPAPSTVYSMAKYAAEKMFEVYLGGTELEHTIVRLEGIIQSQNLVKALCRQVKQDGKIKLKGGKQLFSYLDGDDAASAFAALVTYEGKLDNIYNVGPDRMRIDLVSLASIVVKVGEKLGFGRAEIELEEQDIELNAGMSSAKFMRELNWKPLYDIEDMVERVYMLV